MVGNNFAGPDPRSQQNLAWTPDTGGLSNMAMNLLARQQILAARRGIANQQQKAIQDQVAAKQAELFKQGPHDAGLFTGVYNTQYYKPFMQEQFAKSKAGQMNPSEFNAGYGQMGSAANYLKQEGEKFKQTLTQRAQAEPNFNWGDIQQRALGLTEAQLQDHIKKGGTLESFMPDYNRVVQESIKSSNDYLAPKITKDFFDQTLKGSTKKTVQFTDSTGKKQIREADVPNFLNLDAQGRVSGFNFPQIVDSFMTVPGGRGYVQFKAKELYDSDPAFRQKYDAFFEKDPQKFNKLLYEQVIRPVTGNPLANRDVAFSSTVDLPKTTDEDMEEMQAATPIPGRITIPMGGPRETLGSPERGKADFLAPTISYSLTGKQLNNYRNPIKAPQYVLDGAYMKRVPFNEEAFNNGLADKKIDFASLPVLNDKMYYKDKSTGKILPIDNKNQLMLLTPNRVDQNIKRFGEGNVFINKGTKTKPLYVPVESGQDALAQANPSIPANRQWVSYKPFAKVSFVGQAGPFPVKGESEMGAMMKKGAGADSKTATERFSGQMGNHPRYIPIWQSQPGFIQDIMRNVGVDKFNETLNQLQGQTYSDYLNALSDTPIEGKQIIQ